MHDSSLNRRDVIRLLSMTALGGLVTGTLIGCGGNNETGGDLKGTSDLADLLLNDPHVCRGINTCKNKGKPGTTNECAGQGTCATVASHDCNGLNDCKGHGGCGERPGQNECKGKGNCAVPLSDKTWPKARKRFEELMTKAGKKFGDPPPKNG
jgi:hypothetical protein